MTVQEVNAQITELQHASPKKLNHLRREKKLGFYLRESESRLLARVGDYTDGHTRYHETANGKCIFADCEH
jgi:hypothetical protein